MIATIIVLALAVSLVLLLGAVSAERAARRKLTPGGPATRTNAHGGATWVIAQSQWTTRTVEVR